jgi:hypothetical protein
MAVNSHVCLQEALKQAVRRGFSSDYKTGSEKVRLGYKSQERGWWETTEMPTHDSKSRLTQNF